jgi:hypothetical protein
MVLLTDGGERTIMREPVMKYRNKKSNVRPVTRMTVGLTGR